MKLWLDDIRVPPDETWKWAKTYEEAIILFKDNVVDFASLDHDLAQSHYMGDTSEKTGYHLMMWLLEHEYHRPRFGIRIHSMNPVGKQKMEQVVNDIYGQTWNSLPKELR